MKFYRAHRLLFYDIVLIGSVFIIPVSTAELERHIPDMGVSLAAFKVLATPPGEGQDEPAVYTRNLCLLILAIAANHGY